MRNGRNVEEIQAGDSAELSKRLSDGDVRRFAEAMSGAAQTPGEESGESVWSSNPQAACEILCAGLIAAVLMSRLPGPGARTLSQSLHFRQPLLVGDTITARVTVTDKHELSNWISLSTICRNQKGDVVVDGEAVLMLSPRE